MINVNALACDLRKTVDKRVRDHEIRLLLSYILGDQGKGQLSVKCSALDSSAGHIQRFVSECTGLGVMSAASEVLFDWTHTTGGLSSFDVLPGKLRGVYAKTGVRPDRLYDLAAGPVAGEARGRRRRAKQMFFGVVWNMTPPVDPPPPIWPRRSPLAPETRRPTERRQGSSPSRCRARTPQREADRTGSPWPWFPRRPHGS
ncbi:hypothetical protein [Streptomyces sp. NPDC001948]